MFIELSNENTLEDEKDAYLGDIRYIYLENLPGQQLRVYSRNIHLKI